MIFYWSNQAPALTHQSTPFAFCSTLAAHRFGRYAHAETTLDYTVGSTVPVVMAGALAVGGGALAVLAAGAPAPAPAVAACGCAGASSAERASPFLHIHHNTSNNPNTRRANTPTTTARPIIMTFLSDEPDESESTLRLLALDCGKGRRRFVCQ